MIRAIALQLLLVSSLLATSAMHAETVDIRVYKGELRFVVPAQPEDNSMLIRYRSKSRQVVRIAVDRLVLVNTRSNRVISLRDKSARLANRYDREGYWVTDLHYSDVNLGQDVYRLEGRLTLYLVGSQRSRYFGVYLNTEPGRKPPDSSIDWGLGD